MRDVGAKKSREGKSRESRRQEAAEHASSDNRLGNHQPLLVRAQVRKGANIYGVVEVVAAYPWALYSRGCAQPPVAHTC